MTGTVLVTGGFGLVGSETVKRLAADGRRVVAADLDTPANVKAAKKLPSGVEFRWADLTDREQVERLVSDIAPEAIIHLAAIIAPAIYRMPKVARRVNVDATKTLVGIAEAQPDPPRFVHASSNAVFGPRNPHRTPSPLTADDPMRPCDIYSGTKAEAEEIVQSSSLEWVVLRFGGVLTTDLSALPLSTDAMFFESALPSDNRVQTVDVRDVAWACAAATTADVAHEILLIAGDDSHRHCYGDLVAGPRIRTGHAGCGPAGTARQPRQRRRLVRDRLDGHHPRAGSTAVPALLVAGHDGGVARGVRMETLSGEADRADRPRGHEAPRGVLEGAGHLRRSVGRDPRQTGRSLMGSAIRPPLTT